MNRNQKIGFACMIVGIAMPFVIERLSYKFHMAKAIVEIDLETQAVVNASRKARLIVAEKINAGYYNGRSIVDVENDYEFYRMTARFDD